MKPKWKLIKILVKSQYESFVHGMECIKSGFLCYYGWTLFPLNFTWKSLKSYRWFHLRARFVCLYFILALFFVCPNCLGYFASGEYFCSRGGIVIIHLELCSSVCLNFLWGNKMFELKVAYWTTLYPPTLPTHWHILRFRNLTSKFNAIFNLYKSLFYSL